MGMFNTDGLLLGIIALIFIGLLYLIAIVAPAVLGAYCLDRWTKYKKLNNMKKARRFLILAIILFATYPIAAIIRFL